MSKQAITQATGVTVDQILKVGKLYRTNELRSIQKKLTATSGDLQKLANGWTVGAGFLGSLGDLLTREQRELLLHASQLVESIGNNVTHAKEKRVREEKETKRRQDARDARAKQLVAQCYPLPTENNEQRLNVIKAALIHNRAEWRVSLYRPIEFNVKLRRELEIPSRLYGKTPLQYFLSNLDSIRFELIDGLRDHLAYDDGTAVEERLAALQKVVSEAVAQTALTSEERETIRLWGDALSPAPAEGGAS